MIESEQLKAKMNENEQTALKLKDDFVKYYLANKEYEELKEKHQVLDHQLS